MLQLQFFFRILILVDGTCHDVLRQGQFLDAAVGLPQVGWVMACIGIGDLTRLDVVDAVEHGHEHTVHGLLRQQRVRIGDTLGSPCASDACGTDQRSAHGHEDGSWYALAAHVGNHEADVVLVDAEEVVEVAAHVLRRIHRGGYVELVGILWERREDPRQDGLLNLSGHSQVALDRLQLGVLLLHRLDVADVLYGFFYRHAEIIEVDGLRGEVKGAVVHRLTYVTHIAVGRHHDTLQGRVLHLVDLRQQRQSVHLRHVDVAQDDVEVLLLEQHGERFQTVVGKLKFVLSLPDLSSKVLCQQQFEIHLVVNTEYLNWHNK